jgi:hypothetical protein
LSLSDILADVFDNDSLTSNLNSEIRDYLNTNVEASQTDVLEYWRIKTLIYPSGPRWQEWQDATLPFHHLEEASQSKT